MFFHSKVMVCVWCADFSVQYSSIADEGSKLIFKPFFILFVLNTKANRISVKQLLPNKPYIDMNTTIVSKQSRVKLFKIDFR